MLSAFSLFGSWRPPEWNARGWQTPRAVPPSHQKGRPLLAPLPAQSGALQRRPVQSPAVGQGAGGRGAAGACTSPASALQEPGWESRASPAPPGRNRKQTGGQNPRPRGNIAGPTLIPRPEPRDESREPLTPRTRTWDGRSCAQLAGWPAQLHRARQTRGPGPGNPFSPCSSAPLQDPLSALQADVRLALMGHQKCQAQPSLPHPGMHLSSSPVHARLPDPLTVPPAAVVVLSLTQAGASQLPSPRASSERPRRALPSSQLLFIACVSARAGGHAAA